MKLVLTLENNRPGCADKLARLAEWLDTALYEWKRDNERPMLGTRWHMVYKTPPSKKTRKQS